MIFSKIFFNFCSQKTFIKKTNTLLTFQDLLTKVKKDAYINEPTLADLISRITLFAAVINQNLKNGDDQIKSDPYFHLIEKVNSHKPYTHDLITIFLKDIYQVSKFQNQISIKKIAFFLNNVQFFIDQSSDLNYQSKAQKGIRQILGNQNYFLHRLKISNEECLLQNVFFLLRLCTIYQITHIFIILLNFIEMKKPFYRLKSHEAFSKTLIPIKISMFYATELANLNYFIRNFYQKIFLDKIYPEICLKEKIEGPLNTFLSIGFIFLIAKKFRCYDKTLIEQCFQKSIEIVDNCTDDAQSQEIFLKMMDIVIDFELDFVKPVQKWKDKKWFKDFINLPIIILYRIMSKLVAIEISHFYQKLNFKECSDSSLFVQLESFPIESFEHVFDKSLYIAFLEIIEKNEKKENFEHIPKISHHLSIFFTKVKNIDLSDFPSFQSHNFALLSKTPKSQILKSSFALIFENLLVRNQEIVFESEVVIDCFECDYLIKFRDDLDKKVVIETDGPFHFMTREKFTYRSIARNFFMMLLGWKIVVLRIDLFQTLLTMEKEVEILDFALKKSQNCQMLILSRIE